MIQKLLQFYRDWRYQRIVASRQFSTKTVSEIFTETYRNRYWKSRESVSGQGSELAQTVVLRAALPSLLQAYHIRSLLDVPCGDFNWMQCVDLSGIRYNGGDIVADIVAQNQLKYGAAERSFQTLDLLSDTLPEADCILVRDCLVHFSFRHIEQALANIRKSKISYLLTTSFPEHEKNEDIQTGYWRPLNLQKAPFFFPEPLVCLKEGGSEAKGLFSDKSLCLWKVGP